MELSEYLQKLKDCPDEQLKDELGVYDNWLVYLNINFNRFIDLLKVSNKWESFRDSNPRRPGFLFKPHLAYMQTGDFKFGLFGRDYGEEFRKRLDDYNMSLMLHPVLDKEDVSIRDIFWTRQIAMVINDLGELIIRERIPACMTDSIGWKYREEGERNFARIAYNSP